MMFEIAVNCYANEFFFHLHRYAPDHSLGSVSDWQWTVGWTTTYPPKCNKLFSISIIFHQTPPPKPEIYDTSWTQWMNWFDNEKNANLSSRLKCRKQRRTKEQRKKRFLNLRNTSATHEFVWCTHMNGVSASKQIRSLFLVIISIQAPWYQFFLLFRFSVFRLYFFRRIHNLWNTNTFTHTHTPHTYVWQQYSLWRIQNHYYYSFANVSP